MHDDFIQALQHAIQHYPQGDPKDEATRLGPLAQAQQRQTLHQQVQASIAEGARRVQGGVMPEGPGFFYPPTLLTQVTPSMPVFKEESFGPVLAVTSYQTQEEGIALANESVYGLGGCVFGRDLQRAENIARHAIQSGSCFVNALVATQGALPAGGIGDSGYGRELGQAGIRAFTNIKTVCVQTPS